MNKILAFLLLITTIAINTNALAVTISKCILPDGSIEFTNNGCSKSNRLQSRRTFSQDLTRSKVKIIVNKTRKQKPFKQADFVHLQKKLIGAKTIKEMELYSKKIIRNVNTFAQQGKLGAAYNMVAATYVKISKYLKKRQWEGQSVAEYTFKFRTLFEDILITQSTTSSSTELNQAIQNAWQNYQSSS